MIHALHLKDDNSLMLITDNQNYLFKNYLRKKEKKLPVIKHSNDDSFNLEKE